jgi:hypothetical protein
MGMCVHAGVNDAMGLGLALALVSEGRAEEKRGMEFL